MIQLPEQLVKFEKILEGPGFKTNDDHKVTLETFVGDITFRVNLAGGLRDITQDKPSQEGGKGGLAADIILPNGYGLRLLLPRSRMLDDFSRDGKFIVGRSSWRPAKSHEPYFDITLVEKDRAGNLVASQTQISDSFGKNRQLKDIHILNQRPRDIDGLITRVLQLPRHKNASVFLPEADGVNVIGWSQIKRNLVPRRRLTNSPQPK